MKNNIFLFAALTMLATLFSGCEVIGDIFQAGMYVGVFVVIAIIALIFWLFSRFRR